MCHTAVPHSMSSAFTPSLVAPGLASASLAAGGGATGGGAWTGGGSTLVSTGASAKGVGLEVDGVSGTAGREAAAGYAAEYMEAYGEPRPRVSPIGGRSRGCSMLCVPNTLGAFHSNPWRTAITGLIEGRAAGGSTGRAVTRCVPGARASATVEDVEAVRKGAADSE